MKHKEEHNSRRLQHPYFNNGKTDRKSIRKQITWLTSYNRHKENTSVNNRIYTIFKGTWNILQYRPRDRTQDKFSQIQDDQEGVVHRYRGILLSHKKRWSIAMRDNMDGSWECHAKWNKLDRKSQEPYDSTYAGCKTESNKWTNKTTKQELIDTKNNMLVTRRKGGWEIVKGRWGRLYRDGKRLDFGQWVHMQYINDVL